MAQKVTFVDDLDQSEGAETIRFAYKGQAYEIDLGEKNRDKLEKALKPFIDAARAPGGNEPSRAPRTPRTVRPATSSDKVDYTTLDHAGEVHRGRVTETEAQLVRDNLERVNMRLANEGRPKIDPSDPVMKKRYGF